MTVRRLRCSSRTGANGISLVSGLRSESSSSSIGSSRVLCSSHRAAYQKLALLSRFHPAMAFAPRAWRPEGWDTWAWECREDWASVRVVCNAVELYRVTAAFCGGHRVHQWTSPRLSIAGDGLCGLRSSPLSNGLCVFFVLCHLWCRAPGPNPINLVEDRGMCATLALVRYQLSVTWGVGGVHTARAKWRMRSVDDGLQTDVLECTSWRASLA